MKKRTKAGLKADKNLIAQGVGERTSKKVSRIRTANGDVFKRRNANKYGEAEGGNDYTEKRPNRSDKYEHGGDLSDLPESFPNTDGMSYAKGSTVKGKGKKKKPKEPTIVRGYFEDEPYEYGYGGSAGTSCSYSIGGL